MNKTNVILAIAMIITLQVSAQRVFNSASLTSNHNQDMLTFSVPYEANVVQYRIEASNDNINFEIIGIVRSQGNSVLARTYSYPIHGDGHKHYRVGRTCMNGSLDYSQVISPAHDRYNSPATEQLQSYTGPAIANGR